MKIETSITTHMLTITTTEGLKFLRMAPNKWYYEDTLGDYLACDLIGERELLEKTYQEFLHNR